MSVTFTDFNFEPAIYEALEKQNYTHPTPIQQEALPLLLLKRDVIGVAQTGTGKTAAFTLPFVNTIAEDLTHPIPNTPRALVIVPTRELAEQVTDSFKTYGRFAGLESAAVFGGSDIRKQKAKLSEGVHAIVATPGRLIDLVQQKAVRLDKIEYFVMDEADRLLEMGFWEDIKKLVATLPKERQNAFFSATMPDELSLLARDVMTNPAQITVDTHVMIAETINQRIMHVNSPDKTPLLLQLIKEGGLGKMLIFTRTKLGVDRLVEELADAGIEAGRLHGDCPQRDRRKAVRRFAAHSLNYLVATDVAARGLDIKGVKCVINYMLPDQAEEYVHRIGRTGRAGEEGTAISFCNYPELQNLRRIERLIGQKIELVRNQPFHARDVENARNGKATTKGGAQSKLPVKRGKDRASAAKKMKGISHARTRGVEPQPKKKREEKPIGRKAAVAARKKAEKKAHYIEQARLKKKGIPAKKSGTSGKPSGPRKPKQK